jgi:xanthine dehydrogenase accessory factor
MNDSQLLAKNTLSRLDAGVPVVLISVMKLQGSTPRHEGTKMLVGEDGTTCGTIGGSLIEASAVESAGKALALRKSTVISFELTGQDATDPGMICGGKADLLLDYIPPTTQNREFARRWHAAAGQGGQFYLLSHLDEHQTEVLGRATYLPASEDFYGTSLSGDDFQKLKPELRNVSTTSQLPLGRDWVVVDRIRPLKTLYCFGAGHVAVPTARLAALVGFRVIVLDDRPDYANAERFPEAYRAVVVEDLGNALQGLEIDADSFIIIVTRGHKYDRLVLQQSLETSAGYIGMIGSRHKRQAIYEALMAAGVPGERLAQVHSPIGIDIGGETPEEIAVSIVAELIKVRGEQAA